LIAHWPLFVFILFFILNMPKACGAWAISVGPTRCEPNRPFIPE